jgi:hypothetical protein
MTGKKIVDYLVVENSGKTTLEQTVLSLVQRGWEPLGGLTMTARTVSSGFGVYTYAQAMVRYESP